MSYRLTPEARLDLVEILTHIARDSRASADRVEEDVYSTFEWLAQHRYAGRLRPDLTHRSLRFWTLNQDKNYLVVYDPDTSPLQVVRLLHGARDLSRQF